MGMKFQRHGSAIYRTQRWKAVRLQAKRRDNFRCVSCGSAGRLEVDHIQPIRTHPDLAFDLGNLQSLCVACHSRKTRLEVGLGEVNPAREAWKSLLKKEMSNVGICENPAPAE